MKKGFLFAFTIALLVLTMGTLVLAAAPKAKKVVYFDENVKSGWFNGGDSLREYLEVEGYDVYATDELVQFMTDRIADKAPSVVVFAVDKVPTSLVPKATKKCLLRDYLDAGGKVVWLGDIPLYYVTNLEDGSEKTLSSDGAGVVLGVAHSGTWDQNEEITITPDGEKWGLTETWETRRSIKVSKTLATTLTVLATAPNGDAAAWVKSYGGPEGTGFVRLFDRDAAPSDFSWVKTVAEYGLN